MGRDSVLAQFEGLGVWSRGGERAPHKPLLALYALGRWSGGNCDPIPYTEINAKLRPLLQEFGPPRRSHHPEYPFWHLQTDGVWAVSVAGPLQPRKGKGDNSQGKQKHDSGPAKETFRLEVGHVHGILPGNIVGAIANEAGIPGRAIGAIELYDHFAFVEVPGNQSEKVLKALKRATIRNHKVTANVARPRR